MTNFTSVPWACDPDHIISCFEEYSRLMDHWRKVLPSPPLDVDYEELVEDTEGVARRIVAVVRAGMGAGMPAFLRDAAAGADRQRGTSSASDLQELRRTLEELREVAGRAVFQGTPA